MNSVVTTKKTLDKKALAVVWVCDGDKAVGAASAWTGAIRTQVNNILKAKQFSGKLNTALPIPVAGQWVVLAGLGKSKEVTLDAVRQAAGTIGRTTLAAKLSKVTTLLPEVPGENAQAIAQALVEGATLGTYQYTQQKGTRPKDATKLETLSVVTTRKADEAGVKKGVRLGKVVGEATRWARDLGNTPANHMTPTILANQAKAAGRKFGFKVQVIEETQMKKLGMGALLGVSQGSKQPAKLIVMEYAGGKSRSKKPLALVGKGVTFDSGGISIKPSDKMDEMKFDMCGAAAVLGAMRAIAALKLPVHVVALTPATENLPSDKATKPGDVHKSYIGKTIEVLNTDAEGRLILADALGYAQKKYTPAGMVDLATLTGACVVALGDQASGLMTNNAKFADKVKAAGEVSGDRVWELPLWPAHTEAMQSKVADLKNIGNGRAGTITAGAFLKEFVGDIPWAHIDIAGTAWGPEVKGYKVGGGTGVGVRLLVALAQAWR